VALSNAGTMRQAAPATPSWGVAGARLLVGPYCVVAEASLDFAPVVTLVLTAATQ
jgi:hypothetical protein